MPPGVVGDVVLRCIDGGELPEVFEAALEGGVNAGVPLWCDDGVAADIA